MNTQAPGDLFDLIARWDVEAKTIPSYLVRQGSALTESERKQLMYRRTILKRLIVELRDAMHGMTVHYRGLVNGEVVIESDNEEACWAGVGNRGTVEFLLCTDWVPTDSAIAHNH